MLALLGSRKDCESWRVAPWIKATGQGVGQAPHGALDFRKRENVAVSPLYCSDATSTETAGRESSRRESVSAESDGPIGIPDRTFVGFEVNYFNLGYPGLVLASGAAIPYPTLYWNYPLPRDNKYVSQKLLT